MDSRLRLLSTLAAYDSAERACQIAPTEGQWKKADRLYLELFAIARACGFEPGGAHRHLTTYQFCQQRAAVLRRVFPAHVREARL